MGRRWTNCAWHLSCISVVHLRDSGTKTLASPCLYNKRSLSLLSTDRLMASWLANKYSTTLWSYMHPACRPNTPSEHSSYLRTLALASTALSSCPHRWKRTTKSVTRRGRLHFTEDGLRIRVRRKKCCFGSQGKAGSYTESISLSASFSCL